MPRIRTVKPEFFTSLTIAKLSLSARLTFIGLWTFCDDHGRALDNTQLIKSALWPLDSRHSAAKVEKDLQQLAALELILRYKVAGGKYLQVLGWAEHQRVNRPSTSRIPLPPPPEGSPRAHLLLTESSLGERKGKELGKGKEEDHASLTEETQLLNGEPHRLVAGQWVSL